MHEIKARNPATFVADAASCPHDVAKVERRARRGSAGFDAQQSRRSHTGVHTLRHALWPFSNRLGALEKLLLVASDLVALFAGFLFGRTATWLYNGTSFIDSFTLWWSQNGATRIAIFATLAVGIVMWCWGSLGHYTRRRPWSDEVRQVLQVLLAGFALVAMLVFLGKWEFSRLWLVTSWAMILVLVPLFRYLVKRWMLGRPAFQRPYLIIGSCEQAAEVIAAFESERLMGLRPVAVVSPAGHDCGQGNCSVHGAALPVVHLDDTVETFLKAPGAYQVVIALGRQDELLKRLIQRLTLVRDDVFLIPPLAGLPLYGMELSHFFSHEVLLLRARNNLYRFFPRLVKRSFDIIASFLLLAALAPLMLFIAMKVRADGGPSVFGHTRIGRDGREFKCLKYRTMVQNSADILANLLATNEDARREWQTDFKLKNDPRITPIGRFLRRTSLDELPQLLNVLRGEMSLVGPRPVVRDELSRYGEVLAHYLKVRPGMTGLWQISGRSDVGYDQRVMLDRWYVQNWSLWSDLVILIRTVRVVLRSEGAC